MPGARPVARAVACAGTLWTRPTSLALVYDHDPEDVAALGWEEFIARQWESIFVGYRTRTGLRKMGRRWSDLLEVGLGCSQDLADQLVRSEIIDRADRDLEGTTDAHALVTGMARVLIDVRADLMEMAAERAGPVEGLLEAHARLVGFVRAYAFGPEDEESPPTGTYGAGDAGGAAPEPWAPAAP